MRREYHFELYQDFFITDLNNTIYFDTSLQRDNFFSSIENKLETDIAFNYIIDRQSINVGFIDYIEVSKCTYGCFYSSSERFYFNIISTEYINDKTTKVNFIIDPFVTYCYGDRVWKELYNTQMERQHLSKIDYDKNIKYLTHNSDTLFSGTNVYSIGHKLYQFAPNDDLYVIIQSTVDLRGGFDSFGKTDSPKMPASGGTTYDKITSPVGLYVMSRDDFSSFSNDLRDYSWILQNFIKVTLIPKEFITESSLQRLTTYTKYLIYEFKKNTESVNKSIVELKYSWEELAKIFGVDYNTERHLLRYPYCYIEASTWNGQKININLEDIENVNGLEFEMQICIGYHNQIVIYVKGMNSNLEMGESIIPNGDYMNNAIIITSFDDVPVLVDNYNLNMSKNAYQRQLAEDMLISNRFKNITSGGDVKSRLFDAVSVISNFSLSNIGEKINDEYEFYRRQNAEFNDSKLTTPTITAQSHTNNFQIKQQIFGVTLKFKKIAPEIFDNVRSYHKNFGFDIPFHTNSIKMFTMTKCNYVRCRLNNYKLKFVDSKISDIFRLRLENGVRIWNYPLTNQDLSDNNMK